jgi:hypothetical protein
MKQKACHVGKVMEVIEVMEVMAVMWFARWS